MQPQTKLLLPVPDAQSKAHCVVVADHIRNEIAGAGGRISFAEYMHLALYAPGLGYYSAGATKFGAAGDFITAPEVSPVFGRVLARQCAAILTQVDNPSILEFGAGSGRLVIDILRKLVELNAVPDKYLILEVSADLARRQASLLRDEIPDLIERVVWIDQLPQDFAGVIVANEVLDALPVERFVRTADGIAQLCVAVEDGNFVAEEREAPEYLIAAVAAIETDLQRPLPEGYVSEVCTAAPQWIESVAGALSHGMVLLFDYGVSRRDYYAAERAGGWLRCHFRHHVHQDPYILPGIQDLTAWVDFSSVATAAVDNGLEVAGFVPQARFLIGGGLDLELANFSDLPVAAQIELSGQVKLLTLPEEMGENFKCLGLSRGPITRPGAFDSGDRTASL